MNAKKTDDIFFETEAPPTIPRPEPEPTHFVDVHIYRLGDDHENETRTIEATLEAISKANQPPDDEQSDPIQPRPGRKVSPFVLVCIGVLFLALLGKGYQLYLLPLITPTATITIVPVSTHIQTTAAIQIVTTTPDSSKDQIAGRVLSSITITQAQTVPTTGKAYQQATAAMGMITFYNAAPYAQTIPVGMVLTGKSGREYSVDQAIEVSAVTYPTLGQATVAAHSLTIGTAGNEPAGDIYGPCCMLNLSAVGTAFTGGQDAREYQSVSNQDISATASSLQTSLTASVRSALQTQLHAGETMLTPVCTPTTTSDHKIGDEATQVRVIVDLTCTDVAYVTQVLHDVMNQNVTRDAQKQVGTGSISMGDITLTLTQQQITTTGATVQVQAQSVWYAHFDTARLSTITHMIAGKSKYEAMTILLHTAGIAQVEGLPNSLPPDPSQIHMLLLIG